jgi:hypothetical protein
MNDSNSVQDLLDKASVNKKMSRWLPRLQDQSNEVRIEAADILSELAVSNAELRDSLLPMLLKHCSKEKSWPVVCNSILFHISCIPEKYPEWVEPFLSTYIELSLVHNNEVDVFSGSAIREHALSCIYDLMKARRIDRQHRMIKKIIRIVSDGIIRTEGEQSGGERLYMMKIKDWYEDD